MVCRPGYCRPKNGEDIQFEGVTVDFLVSQLALHSYFHSKIGMLLGERFDGDAAENDIILVQDMIVPDQRSDAHGFNICYENYERALQGVSKDWVGLLIYTGGTSMNHGIVHALSMGGEVSERFDRNLSLVIRNMREEERHYARVR